MEGPSALVESLADYGPDNTRPGGDRRPFLFLGTRHLLGFDLEIMEPNFLRFVDQAAQRPCFVGPRIADDTAGLRLQRLAVVVPDLDTASSNLVEILTPGCRSNPYAMREGASARAFRIVVGGLELEYCQPLSTDGSLAELLARHGAGVVTAEFGATSVDSLLERVRADGTVRVTEAVDYIGEDREPRWQVECRELVGFDVVLETR
jgi:hypothetical protein